MLTVEKAREIIDKVGLTQYKISAACSLCPSMLSGWLNNSRSLKEDQINRIEAHLSKFEELM